MPPLVVTLMTGCVENDVLLAASGRRYIVSGAPSTSALTAVVKDMDGTAVATVDAQEFTVIGNAYGQGTAQPKQPFEMQLKLRKTHTSSLRRPST